MRESYQRWQVVFGTVRRKPSILVVPLLISLLLMAVGLAVLLIGGTSTANSLKESAQDKADSTVPTIAATGVQPGNLLGSLTAAIMISPQHFAQISPAAGALLAPLWYQGEKYAAASGNSLVQFVVAPLGFVGPSYPMQASGLSLGPNTDLLDNSSGIAHMVRQAISTGSIVMEGPLGSNRDLVVLVQPIMLNPATVTQAFANTSYRALASAPARQAASNDLPNLAGWWGVVILELNITRIENSIVAAAKQLAAQGWEVQLTFGPQGPQSRVPQTNFMITSKVLYQSSASVPDASAGVASSTAALGTFTTYVWIDNWRPSHEAPLIAVVVVGSVAVGALVFFVFLSRQENRMLLERVLPEEAILRMHKEWNWKSVEDKTNRSEKNTDGTPATTILAVVDTCMLGKHPALRDLVTIREALNSGMDVYRPVAQDLGRRMMEANVDDEVKQALMAQLTGTAAAISIHMANTSEEGTEVLQDDYYLDMGEVDREVSDLDPDSAYSGSPISRSPRALDSWLLSAAFPQQLEVVQEGTSSDTVTGSAVLAAQSQDDLPCVQIQMSNEPLLGGKMDATAVAGVGAPTSADSSDPGQSSLTRSLPPRTKSLAIAANMRRLSEEREVRGSSPRRTTGLDSQRTGSPFSTRKFHTPVLGMNSFMLGSDSVAARRVSLDRGSGCTHNSGSGLVTVRTASREMSGSGLLPQDSDLRLGSHVSDVFALLMHLPKQQAGASRPHSQASHGGPPPTGNAAASRLSVETSSVQPAAVLAAAPSPPSKLLASESGRRRAQAPARRTVTFTEGSQSQSEDRDSRDSAEGQFPSATKRSQSASAGSHPPCLSTVESVSSEGSRVTSMPSVTEGVSDGAAGGDTSARGSGNPGSGVEHQVSSDVESTAGSQSTAEQGEQAGAVGARIDQKQAPKKRASHLGFLSLGAGNGKQALQGLRLPSLLPPRPSGSAGGSWDRNILLTGASWLSTLSADNPHRPLFTQLDQVLASCEWWAFDAYALDEATQGHPLSVLGFWLFQSSGLIQTANLGRSQLVRFLQQIEEGYSSQNPYHNRRHAADVLQTMHVLLHHGGLMPGYADRHVMLSCYLAAIVHDYEHRGKTNDFLVHSHDDLAVRYNDRSPMENHHVAAAFALLKQPEFNFLRHMPRSQWEAMRKMVIDLVLATDMKQHFSILGQFSSLHHVGGSNMAPGSGAPAPSRQSGSGNTASVSGTPRPPTVEGSHHLMPVSDTDRLLSLQMALKCSDLGHLAAPLTVHLRWVSALEAEFFLQGDLERSLGLPISPLCDRGKEGVTKSQTSFLDFVVRPLFKAFTTRFTAAQPLLDAVMANYAYWQAQARPSPIAVQGLRRESHASGRPRISTEIQTINSSAALKATRPDLKIDIPTLQNTSSGPVSPHGVARSSHLTSGSEETARETGEVRGMPFRAGHRIAGGIASALNALTYPGPRGPTSGPHADAPRSRPSPDEKHLRCST